MEELRLSILNAKKELNNILNFPGEIQEKHPIEINEIRDLEEKLKHYIQSAEKILKQFNKNNK